MEEIRPGVWIIYAENNGRFPFAHSLYLAGERPVLIDTGAGRGLLQLAGKVDHVYLSHYHRDHVRANDLFVGASFSIHPQDAPGVASAEGFHRLTGLDGSGGSYWETFNQKGFTAVPLTGEHDEGDRADLGGGLTLRVVHTPGHTPGHCAFLVEEYGLIFTADIDLSAFGPWYGNSASNLEHFQESVQKLRSLNPSLLVTSHSPPVREDIDGKLEKYGAVIEERHELVYSLLRREAMKLEQLIDLKPIYGRHREPAAVYRYFEGRMLLQHLEVLRGRRLVDYAEEEALYRAR